MAQVDFFEALQGEVEREIMACIGCNDCLLACPLPEAKQVTIAQLNHAVLDEQIASADVIGFVQACTQCQQCVPVCPADLHRADIVLYNKLKVEDVAADRDMPLQVGPSITASGWTVDALARHLSTLPLFEEVDAGVLRRGLQSSTLRHLEPREVLVREGEFHERLFVVLDGSVEQTATSTASDATRILILGPGSFHGELAVMGNQEESYTISAVLPATVLELPKATVYRLMREAPAFEQRMEDLYQRRAIWTHARTSPMLAALPESAVEDLLARARFRVVRQGAVVFREGDRPGDLHLVRTGFLRVARRFGADERVLQYFREGDVFGGVALLFNQLQSATVSANTRAEIVTIPGDAVMALLERSPELRRSLIAEATRSEETILQLGSAVRPAPKDRASSQILSIEGLVDAGVMQGHEVLLIDTSICTDCNNCVDACGRRHGYSRLERAGLQLGNLLFPSACRHCEDPVCLLCSVNGIVREPDGEIRIVPDNCIGCGACAERCPYDNIQMHELDAKASGILSRVFHRKAQPETDAEEHLRQKIAVKCDLCAGYDEYACVHACPVGAAMRVDPVEVFGRGDLLIGLEMKRATV
ncbi:MAG TPA: cyclic nucleotide-binding domain-containing protein [Actinomycetota bacterium]|nr:cyclic nucleotide-binding domain-containing protein [Actinomycetota bacterium]